MSIFDIFKAAAPAPAPAVPAQPVAPTPGNIPASAGPASATAATAGTAPNGTVPATSVVTDGAAKSGLDAFSDIWNTAANPAAQGQPLFNVSQEKMMEAARKQNFGTGVTPELMAKVTAGGPEAAAAMMEMMNMVAQNAYAQSAFASTRLIEGALEKSQFAKAGDLETRFKSMSVENNLRAENPLFSHPAAQPMLQAVQSQLLVKYPTATPAELTKMAQDYLVSFAQQANAPATQAAATATAKASEGMDWTKFL